MNTTPLVVLRSPAVRLRFEPMQAIRVLLPVALLAVVCWFFFFHRLAARDLWSSHEARAAQNAQRMLDDRSFGLPRLFDDRYDLQKPPLYYWLVAAIAWLRGSRVDAWAERLPAAMAASGCVFLVWHWLRRRGRPIAAVVAAIALASMVHFTWLGRTGRIDMPLAFSIGLAILALPSRRWWWLGGLALATGLLLKGPVGMVLPAAVLIVAGIAGKTRFGWRPIAGAAIGVLLGLPWFVWANGETKGEFFRVFFWYHNVQRALGDAEALAVHPWWYYGPRLLVDSLPWSLLLPISIVQLIRERLWKREGESLFGLIWLAVFVGVLSCAKFKRADYLIPAYPGLAILLGCSFEVLWRCWSLAWRRRVCIVGAVCVISVGIAWGWHLHVSLPQQEAAREHRTFARYIRDVAPEPNVILFFRAEAHDLAFHLGRPVNTFLEWENLDIWAGRPGTHYLVMPPDCAAEWSEHVRSGRLEEIVRNTDLSGGRHEKPLVLMRTIPGARNLDAASRE